MTLEGGIALNWDIDQFENEHYFSLINSSAILASRVVEIEAIGKVKLQLVVNPDDNRIRCAVRRVKANGEDFAQGELPAEKPPCEWCISICSPDGVSYQHQQTGEWREGLEAGPWELDTETFKTKLKDCVDQTGTLRILAQVRTIASTSKARTHSKSTGIKKMKGKVAGKSSPAIKIVANKIVKKKDALMISKFTDVAVRNRDGGVWLARTLNKIDIPQGQQKESSEHVKIQWFEADESSKVDGNCMMWMLTQLKDTIPVASIHPLAIDLVATKDPKRWKLKNPAQMDKIKMIYEGRKKAARN